MNTWNHSNMLITTVCQMKGEMWVTDTHGTEVAMHYNAQMRNGNTNRELRVGNICEIKFQVFLKQKVENRM